MKNALFFIGLLLMGCKDKTPDPSSRVEGLYPVYLYVVGEDTLISPEKGNLSPYPYLSIRVERDDENTVKVTYTIDPNGGHTGGAIQTIKLEPKEDDYTLISPSNPIDTYFGYTDGKIFYIDSPGWDHTKEDWPLIRTKIVGRRQ